MLHACNVLKWLLALQELETLVASVSYLMLWPFLEDPKKELWQQTSLQNSCAVGFLNLYCLHLSLCMFVKYVQYSVMNCTLPGIEVNPDLEGDPREFFTDLTTVVMPQWGDFFALHISKNSK